MDTLKTILIFGLVAGCSDPETDSVGDGGDAASDSSSDGIPSGNDGDGTDATLSDSTDQLDMSFDPLPYDEFCNELLEALCLRDQRCSSVTNIDCDDWDLTTYFENRCAGVAESIQGGRVAYDDQRAAVCIHSISESTCFAYQPSPIEGPDHRIEGPCRGVFTGLVPLGGDCYPTYSLQTDECAEGFCLREEGQCPGQCTEFLELGENCLVSWWSCGPDAVCPVCSSDDIECQTICIDPPGLGEPCEYWVCDYGLACGYENICQPQSGDGEPCDAGQLCQVELVCIDGTCRRSVASGDECRWDENCPDDHHCIGTPTKTCQPYLVEGEECTRDYGHPRCQVDLVCFAPNDHTGDCQERGEPNDPCYVGTCNYHTADCSTWGLELGICLARADVGEACQYDEDCIWGLWCMDNGQCHLPGDVGGPCRTIIGNSCLEGLWCRTDTSVCDQPAGEGDYCGDSFAASSCEDGFYCESEACTALLELGAPCSRSAACLGGYCEETCVEEPSWVCSGP